MDVPARPPAARPRLVALALLLPPLALAAPPPGDPPVPPVPPGRLVIQQAPFTATLAVDPAGRLLASSYGGLTLYALPQRALLATHPLPLTPDRLAFAAGGRWVLAARSHRAVLVDPETGASTSLERGETLLRDAAVARESARGYALEGFSPPTLATFEVEGGGGGAGPPRRAERGAWPVPKACDEVRTSDRGEVALLLCGGEVRLFGPDGPGAVLPLAAPADDAWLDRNGRWAVLVRGKVRLRLAWLDLRSGAETPLPATPAEAGGQAEVRRVIGLFGAAPELLALAAAPAPAAGGGSEDWLISARPGAPAPQATRLGAGMSAAAFDPVRDVFVLGGTSLALFDRRGQPLGRLGGAVRWVTSLRHDPATDRLWAEVPEGLLGGTVRELDLAEGDLRPVPAEGVAPAALLDVSTVGGDVQLADLRRVDDRLGPVEGVAPGTLRWGARVSPDAAVVAGPTSLGLVDLATRRLARWLPIPAEPVPLFAGLPGGTDLLLVLRPDGTLETWEAGVGRRLAAQQTPWTREAAWSPLRGVARLPGGALLFAAADGLHRAEAPGGALTPLVQGTAVEAVTVAPDGRRVAVAAGGLVMVCALEPGDALGACARVAGGSPVFLRGGAELAHLASGGVQLHRLADGALLVTAWAGAGADALLATPDGPYKATPGGLDLGAWADGARVRALEEVDLELNRPAEVLARLGRATPERLDWWRAAEARRRRQAGARAPSPGGPGAVALRLREVPPASTAAASLRLPLRLAVGEAPPVRLHLRVNGVPVLGRAGLPVADGASAGAVVEPEVQVPIGPGENRIALSAIDARGREAALERLVVTGTGERRPGRIFFLGIGVSAYRDPAHRLAYAAKDVADVAAALERLAGGAVRTRLLLDGRATRDAVRDARAFLEEARFEDLVVLHAAGHGVVDGAGTWRFATHDLPFDRPEAGGLTFDDLEALLDGLGAGTRVLLVDACHAGARDGDAWAPLGGGDGAATGQGGVVARGLVQRRPAGEAAPAAAGTPGSLFADVRRGAGATVIAAAGAEEFAFEGRGTANGLFTHAVLRSLREGAGVSLAGELWLEPLVREVRARVVALTGGRQVPQVRDGNPAFRRPLLSSPPLRAVHRPARDEPVRALAVAAGGGALALVTDAGVRVVGARGGPVRRAPLPPGEAGAGLCRPSCRLALSPDGRALAVVAAGRVLALDVAAGRWRTAAEGPGATLSADARWALLLREGRPVVADLAAPRARLLPVPDEAWACTWAPAAGRLRCRVGGAVREWDPATGRTGAAWPVPAAPPGEAPRSLALAAGGRLLVDAPLAFDRDGGGTALDVETGGRTPLPAGDAVLLGPHGPALPWPDTLPLPQPVEVPILDAGGQPRASLRVLGSAADAAARGELLLGPERIVSREWRAPPLSAAQLAREGTLFRVHDARTGEPAGWFGVPIREPALAAAPGTGVYVVDTSSGAVHLLELPAGR